MFALKYSFVVGSVSGASNEWGNWKQQYGKVYNGNDEDNFRRSVFEHNLEIYADIQKLNPEAKFGPTKFSDMTPAEFKATMLTGKPSGRQLVHANLSHLPAEDCDFEDWTKRGTTPVKDQGQCGSCFAFAAVSQIESDNILRTGGVDDAILSTQQLNDCTAAGAGSRRGGCDGGTPTGAYDVVEALGGIALESTYGPYIAKDGTCRTPQPHVQVTDWQWVGQGSESEMQQYVCSHGPLAAAVDASEWSGYQGGVVTSCGNSVDHAVQIVGITVSGATWKIRNSWGSDWGEDGFLRLQAGSNLCGITSQPSKVTTAAVAPTQVATNILV